MEANKTKLIQAPKTRWTLRRVAERKKVKKYFLHAYKPKIKVKKAKPSWPLICSVNICVGYSKWPNFFFRVTVSMAINKDKITEDVIDLDIKKIPNVKKSVEINSVILEISIIEKSSFKSKPTNWNINDQELFFWILLKAVRSW